MQALVDDSCRFSFDDLHLAATGEPMTDAARAKLYALPQDQRNAWVRRMVGRTGGGFACEDRRGGDGVVYTAFWASPAP